MLRVELDHEGGVTVEDVETLRSVTFDSDSRSGLTPGYAGAIPPVKDWPDWLRGREDEFRDALEQARRPWSRPRGAPRPPARNTFFDTEPSLMLGLSFQGPGTYRAYDVADRSLYFDFHYGVSSQGAGVEVPSEAEWAQCVPAWLAAHRAECLEMFMSQYRRPVTVFSPWTPWPHTLSERWPPKPKKAPPGARTLNIEITSQGAHGKCVVRVSDTHDDALHFEFYARPAIEVPSEQDWPLCVPDWLVPRRAECLERFSEVIKRSPKVVAPWTGERFR